MAENETVFTFKGEDSGLSKLVKDLTAAVNTLNTTVGDLGDNLQRATRAQRNYAKSASNTAKSTKETQRSVKELSTALNQTGNNAQKALRKISTDTVRREFSKLSSGEIVKLNQSLREAGVSLADFIDQGGQSLNLASIQRFETALENIENESKTTLTTFKLLKNELSGGADSQFADDLLNYKSVQTQAESIVGEIQTIRNQLEEIGPAARAGNQQAIDQFNDLYKTLERTTERAEDLRRELRESGQRAQGAFASQNESLGALGFREIRLNDIFPTQEQQKVTQLQAKIDQAVRDSVQEGAVKRSLNFFLAQDRALESVDRNVVSLTSHLPRLRYALYDVSNTATIFGTAIIAGIGATVKFAADYERAFADVIRTTGVTGGEIEKLRNDLIDLSQTLPVGFAQLAEIATLAGQLNIATNVIDEFTETVAKFSATTDVTIEAAATAFGRLDQLVDGVNGQFNNLGSSILKVGVNAVATESDIINIATQIASVANIAGFSAAELIGFSSALASVGTRPELARGTFTRLFTEINQAVSQGGDELARFAQITGQSQQEFVDAWAGGRGTDQVLAILRGLNVLGKDAEQALRDIGITSVRDVPTLLKLAQSFEEVESQVNLAKIGFFEGSELTEQYGVITETLSERLEVLKNNFGAILAALGSLAGPLSVVVDSLNSLLRVVEAILQNPFGRFVAGLAGAFGTLLGVSALAVGALARFGGSLAGAGTAMIELFETVTFTKIQVDQLTNSTENETLASLRQTATKKQQIATQKAQSVATLRQDVLTKQTTASTIRYNVALSTQTARLAATRASLDAYIARVRLAGAVALNAARQTRAWGLAVRSLKVAFGLAALTVITAAIEKAVEAFGELNKETETAEERFSNWGEILEAVKQDSADFNVATEETSGNFDVIGLSVSEAGEDVSDYAKVLAITSGEQDTLREALGQTTSDIERQTLAIGENTRALLRQKLAQEILAAGQVDFRDLTPEEFLAGAPDAEALTPRALREVSQVALAQVFSNLELTDELKEAGFDIKEFSDLIVEGNTAAANSYAQKLGPAAQDVIDILRDRSPELWGEEINTLSFLVADADGVLQQFTGSGAEVIESLRGIALEAAITGKPIEEVADATGAMNDAFDAIVENIYGPINAQRELNESLESLGAVFFEQGAQIAATSTELQDVLQAIWDTSEGGEDAAANFAGFYQAIIEGGYATEEQLRDLQQTVLDTFLTFQQVELDALRSQRDILQRQIGTGRGVQGRIRAGRELRDVEEQIRTTQEVIDNFNFDSFSKDFDIDPMINGFRRAEEAVNDTKDAVEETEEVTEQAVRTLLDYGSDLENVFSRAFDLRFGRGISLDQVTDAWEQFTEQVEEANQSLEELIATQQDLAADRAIKEYFLSVAEAYDDQLRASKLRAEIADLDNQSAEAARELAEAQESAAGATALTGDTTGARRNRQALLGLVRNYQDYITVLAESGAGQDELREATEKARREFIKQATELGFAESEVMMYAEAFDDVRTAIDRVPRDITVDFNADPALQALNELNAKLDQSIEKAKELNRVSNVPTPPAPTPPAEEVKSISGATKASLTRDLNVFNATIAANPVGSKARNQAVDSKRWTLLALREFAQGGFTGRGGRMQPAGIVHKGEYVIPQQYVNQSTGLPDPSFLAQLQNGMRSFAQGGFVGGGMAPGDAMMVELSPYDRKLLENAGNVQLRLNGRVVAEATNRSNSNEARRGSN